MYNIKLEMFEGPFDLLFHLIEKNEVDLFDIPIAVILDQYMAHINVMQEMDLNVTSDFILMAATLLEIKSKMLLPKVKDEGEQIIIEETDPREELIKRLVDYKKYKLAAVNFKESSKYNLRFFREVPDLKYIDKKVVFNYSAEDLYNTYKKIISRNSPKEEILKIQKDEFTVEEKIKDFIFRLIKKPVIFFSEYIKKTRIKSEIIVSFMAVLELIRLNKVTAEQKDVFGDIIIKKIRGEATNE